MFGIDIPFFQFLTFYYRVPAKGSIERDVRFSNLTVFNLKSGDAEFGRLANRNMSLQCTVNDGMVWLADDSQTVCVEYVELTP